MLKRWITGSLLGIVIGAIILAAFGYLWLKSSLPTYSNTRNAPWLEARVEVIHDVNAVPHIFADSTKDAYLALGYVHARDRLWQMEIQRRVGQGRMAEILGSQALEVDLFMRTMGLYRAAEQSFAVLSEETRQALYAYAQGVNSYLDNRKDPLPIEFQLTQHTPEPWVPADSMVWLKMMAFILSGNYRTELLRARLLEGLTLPQLQDLFPQPKADDPVTIVNNHSRFRSAETKLDPAYRAIRNNHQKPVTEGLGKELDLSWSLGNLPATQFKASNVWVISGQHTDSGAPILVNDPHLSLNAPVLWYLAQIVTPELTLSGATVPGLPFHLLGHNGQIAWGLTATGSDVQDLYYETLSSSNPDQYMTPEGWRNFEVRLEKIKVRFSDEVLHTVRKTRHGPVFSDISETAAALAGDQQLMSLAFTALQINDHTIEALYRLNRARNWSDLLDSVQLIKAPQLNMMYADVRGNIGFIAPAKIPIRKTGNGFVPAHAADGTQDWIAYIDFHELPQVLNPPAGWLVNANNAIIGPNYPYFLTWEWEEAYRVRRLEKLIQHHLNGKTSAYTLRDAETMLMDQLSLAALELLPLMTSIDGTDSIAQQALMLLRDWDGVMDRERPEPLLFMTWLRRLNHVLYADELGPLATDFAGLHPKLVADILTEEHSWCDDVLTQDVTESCAEILNRSLQIALGESTAVYGADIDQWRWGDVHRAEFAHPLLDRIPLLKEMFNIGIETGGGNYTVNRGASYAGPIDDERKDNNFVHRHGPGLRAIYDLADLENSRFMISTGQSGNPLSPYYNNFVKSWRDGGFITLSSDREQLLRSALGILVLQP